MYRRYSKQEWAAKKAKAATLAANRPGLPADRFGTAIGMPSVLYKGRTITELSPSLKRLVRELTEEGAIEIETPLRNCTRIYPAGYQAEEIPLFWKAADRAPVHSYIDPKITGSWQPGDRFKDTAKARRSSP